MSANPIRWVLIMQDYDGKPLATIARESTMSNGFPAAYEMTRSSQRCLLAQIEKQAGNRQISLNFGSLTGKLDLILHMNLPTAR